MKGRVRDPQRRSRARLVGLASAALLLSLAASTAAAPTARPAGAAIRADREGLPSVGSGVAVRAPLRATTRTDMPHGIRALERTMRRIETAEPWASAAKPAIIEYYPDVERRVVRVGVERVTPRLARAAARTFGDSVVLYRANRYYRMSRNDDPAPHTAGAAIETDLGQCTSGFGVARRGSTYFLGTGHCFRGPGDTASNNGRSYGRVAERRLGDKGPDASLVASHFGPRVYVGGSDSDTWRALRGTRTPEYGGRLCASGARTGESCSGRRRESDICVRFGDGLTTCHLTRAVSADGTSLVQPGDSGGPVYAGGPGTDPGTDPGAGPEAGPEAGAEAGAEAVGIIVGGNRDGTELLYHPVGYLLELWDSRLLTSPQRIP